MPPSRSGIADYSALLLPELEKRVDVVVARSPGGSGSTRRPTSRCTTSATTPRRTAGSSRRCGKRPGVVVLHDFVLHHLVVGLTFARGDAAGYLAAMERDGRARRAPARLRGARQQAAAALGDAAGGLPARRARCSTTRPALIVHSHYVEQRARETGYSGPIVADPAPGLADPELVAPRARRAATRSYGCFGHLNETKRIAELVSAFARLRERRPGARLLLVGSLAGAARPPGAARGRRAPRLRPRGRALVADGRLRRDRLPALADDGRDLRQRDPRALARQAARRQRRRLVRGASRTTRC